MPHNLPPGVTIEDIDYSIGSELANCGLCGKGLDEEERDSVHLFHNAKGICLECVNDQGE